MPTIPSLERRTVTPSSRVTNVGVADIGSVGRELGGAIDRTRARFDEAEQKKTRYEIADAKSKFGILMHQQNNAYEQDNDYDTIPQRWGEKVRSGADELLAGVSDTEARNMLRMEISERIAASEPLITQLAFGKKREVKRADVFAQMEANHEVYLGKDPVLAKNAALDTKELLQAATDEKFFTQEVADEAYRTWKEKAAVGRLNMFDPEDQLIALDDPLIKDNLKSDTMAKLRRGVEDKVLDKQAMALVDGLGVDFSQMDALKLSHSLADQSELRTKVEQRANAAFVMKEKAEREQMEMYHNDWVVPVAMGEREIDPKDPQFLKLDADLKKDLISISTASKTPATRTNPDIYEELIQLQTDKNFAGLQARVRQAIKDKEMSASDIAQFMRIGIEGQVPEEYEAPFTIDNRIEAILTSGGRQYNNNDKLAVREHVRQWYESQVKTYGKAPSDDEIDKKIGKYAMDVELNPSTKDMWFGSSKKKYSNLTYDQKVELFSDTLDAAKDAPDDQFDFIISEITQDAGPRTNADGVDFKYSAILTGALNRDKLTDETQAELVGFIKRTSPKHAAEMTTKLTKKKGRAPSVNEFLEGWAEEWNAN